MAWGGVDGLRARRGSLGLWAREAGQGFLRAQGEWSAGVLSAGPSRPGRADPRYSCLSPSPWTCRPPSAPSRRSEGEVDEGRSRLPCCTAARPRPGPFFAPPRTFRPRAPALGPPARAPSTSAPSAPDLARKGSPANEDFTGGQTQARCRSCFIDSKTFQMHFTFICLEYSCQCPTALMLLFLLISLPVSCLSTYFLLLSTL